MDHILSRHSAMDVNMSYPALYGPLHACDYSVVGIVLLVLGGF